MPTRMYSIAEFIYGLLQAFAALCEADERDKRGNSYHNDNQVKHVIPPRRAVDVPYPQPLQYR